MSCQYLDPFVCGGAHIILTRAILTCKNWGRFNAATCLDRSSDFLQMEEAFAHRERMKGGNPPEKTSEVYEVIR